MSPDELASACAEAMWADDHASRGLGISLDHVGPNQSRLSMTVTQAMANGHGMCHGGFLFALADSAFAFACNTDNQRRVAAHCSITYLAPAELGERLIATAEQRAEAGRSGLYDIRVETDSGRLIAEFRGLCRSLGQTFFPVAP